MSKGKLLLHMKQGQYKGRKEGDFLVVRDSDGVEIERMPLKSSKKEEVVVEPVVTKKEASTSWASAYTVEDARRNLKNKGIEYASYRPHPRRKTLLEKLTGWLS